ncbi:hypothetical protein SK128_001961, partial [Halocaridina rubra]
MEKEKTEISLMLSHSAVMPACIFNFRGSGFDSRPERGRTKGQPYTPFECSTCGVSLRTFKKCWAFHRQDNMTAHLCITTYRSPNNEVLKLE